jgi:hypothetical protein
MLAEQYVSFKKDPVAQAFSGNGSRLASSRFPFRSPTRMRNELFNVLPLNQPLIAYLRGFQRSTADRFKHRLTADTTHFGNLGDS